jgi:CheY-like chemotaxis protein
MPDRFRLVMIDDSHTDAFIIERVFKERAIPVNLQIFQNGDALIAHFQELSKAPHQSPTPHLIMIDLNLPGYDGSQVLAHIKRDSIWKLVPTVVLTTSRRDEDMIQAYELRANSFLNKPDEYAGYVELVHTLYNYWYRTDLVPSTHA